MNNFNNLKSWTFSICIAIISSYIIKIILPKSQMSKIINFSISIFLLSIMFSDLNFNNINLNFDSNISDNFYSFNDNIEDFNKKLEILRETKTFGAIEKKLQEIVRQDLLLKNINPIKILININTNDKSSILINKMEIFLKEGEEYDEKTIKNYIGQKYNIVPDIKY